MKTSLKVLPALGLSFFHLSFLSAQERPNIIYIFTDQQTASAMSCMGNEDLKTPNMDRIRENGMLFTNAYCTSPLSGPSRASMFTGYFPETISMPSNWSPLPDSLHTQTLGTLVEQAGYECAYGGKWHVPDLSVPNEKRGFKNIHNFGDIGLAESCVEFLSQDHDKPFFLVAAFDNPHNICEYARSLDLPYGNIPQPDIRDCPGLPLNHEKNPYDADIIAEMQRNFYKAYPTRSFTAEDWRYYRYTYCRLVEKVDKEIGKIVDVIDKKNLWKNTVVIFTSDHGDGVGAHRWNQKSALYEEVVKIPMIVTLPGKKNKGQVMPQLISNGVDFFASICEWTGAKRPAYTPGKSFVKLVEKGDPKAPHQDFIVTETKFDAQDTRGCMVRTARYKYVLYDKGKYREQLYDMTTDPGEMRNLAMENTYNDIIMQHRDLLEKWVYSVRNTQKKLHLLDIPGRKLKKNDKTIK